MTYLLIGALIVLVALISVSDLIYRRVFKSSQRRRLAGRSRKGPSQPLSGSVSARPGSQPPNGARGGSGARSRPATPSTEFVRVKLLSGRVMEGWREKSSSTEVSGGLADAFDLDVSRAFDPNGNPMSFPSDSFIVFTSQIENLDVLEAPAEGRARREVPAERERSAGTLTAPIAPVSREPEITEPAERSDARAAEPAPAQEEPREGMGRVIPLPELEQISPPAAVLAPAPEPPPEAGQLRRADRPPPAPEPAAPSAPAPEKRRRARPLRWLALIAALLVVALLADSLFTFLALSHALESARGDLRRGAHALLAGRYQSARAEFLKAASASGTADSLQGRPSFWVVSQLPRIQRDAAALKALGRSSDFASQAGLDAVQAIRAMGAPADGLAAAIYSHGQINLNAAARGEFFFPHIENLLGRAYGTLLAAPQPVFGPVQSALSVALAKVAEAKDAIHKTRSLVEALPSLFGRDQTRHYLLLFGNPSISRAAGGPINFFGILTAKSGSLSVGKILPVDHLPPSTARASLAPSWFRRAYGDQQVFSRWEQLTLSPSFNAVAPLAESRYLNATGTSVDGVIEMDPVALGLMARSVGSLQQPGYDVNVNAGNAVKVLTHDAYLHFGPDEHARDLWVAGLIEEVWRRVARGDASAKELQTALGDASRGSHFTMYSNSGSDEGALNQVGVGATFATFEPNVQMAVTNNRTFSRIGYYERRGTSTQVQLTRWGQAFVSTTFQFTNTAPKTLPPILVRNDQSVVDHTQLSLILPLHAKVLHLRIGGAARHYAMGVEGANPRLSLPLDVPAGQTVRVVCSYTIPHAMQVGPDGGIFRFISLPQATAFPDATSVTVLPPEGFEVLPGGSVGGKVQDSSYLASDTTGGLLTLSVKVAPPA